MKFVIQCAGGKDPEAGYMRTEDGTPVLFVADPTKAPARDGLVYVKSDEDSGDGKTWREKLLAYNKQSGNNPFNLFPAYRLYRNNGFA